MRWAALCVTACLLGCGGTPDAPPDPLAPYPESRFIVAEGQGPTALAAADDARVRLSAQIRARITARLTVETQQSSAGSVERSEQQIITETTFDRAELIRTPRALQRCPRPAAPDGCTAVAVLDRAEAGGALRDAAAEPSARFRAAAGPALSLGAERWIPFTTALRTAEFHFAELARAGWQRAAIVGGVPADFAEDRALYRALQGEAARRAAGLMIGVAPALGFDGPWAARVEDGLIDGFSRLGVAPHRGACRGLLARPSGEVVCRRGGLGPTCRLTLRVRLERCAGAELVTLELPGIAAVDPRDESRARTRLAGEIDGAKLAPLLAGSLSGVLPIARVDAAAR